MNKNILFFGCGRSKGHHWWTSEGMDHYASVLAREFPEVNNHVIEGIDGTYTIPNGPECVYREVNIGPVKILAWNDYSIDQRPGSNSALIGKGFATADEMILYAEMRYPNFMARQKQPLTPEKL